ncbi:MAG TPA: T9SS type A sorting domain-containing protein, partial [Chitinophagaceae bacterium]|nr:T9SS type A sorting domain-containing protein [Chitinophagaceae bacterium]
EINADRFVVQRSKDGSTFSDIASEKARGGANVRTFYSVNDRDVKPGNYTYRLKMVDMDGSLHYSQAITVTIRDKRNLPLHILTNPANAYLEFEFGSVGNNARYRISDLTGKTLQQGIIPPATSRFRTNEISRLASGIYLLELQQGNDRQIRKFVKQ